MSIMDIFRSKSAVVAAPNPAPTSANTNPTVPSESSPVQKPAGVGSPVDKYTDLWKVDDKAPPANQGSLIPNINFDPVKLADASKKLDFTAHITDENLAKALGGDKAAFAEIINGAVQLGFAQSAAASAEISRQHLTSAQGVLKDNILPAALRADKINDAVTGANAAFNHPSVKPMVDMMSAQFQVKYPTASPAEIAQMAKEYLSDFATKVTGVPVAEGRASNASNVGVRVETDWPEFFNLAKAQTQQ